MIKVLVLIAALIVAMDLFIKIIEIHSSYKDEQNDLNDQVLQGCWETLMNKDYDRLTCNVCLHPALCDRYGYQQATKYCPHCGSWMCDEEGEILVDP